MGIYDSFVYPGCGGLLETQTKDFASTMEIWNPGMVIPGVSDDFYIHEGEVWIEDSCNETESAILVLNGRFMDFSLGESIPRAKVFWDKVGNRKKFAAILQETMGFALEKRRSDEKTAWEDVVSALREWEESVKITYDPEYKKSLGHRLMSIWANHGILKDGLDPFEVIKGLRDVAASNEKMALTEMFIIDCHDMNMGEDFFPWYSGVLGPRSVLERIRKNTLPEKVSLKKGREVSICDALFGIAHMPVQVLEKIVEINPSLLSDSSLSFFARKGYARILNLLNLSDNEWVDCLRRNEVGLLSNLGSNPNAETLRTVLGAFNRAGIKPDAANLINSLASKNSYFWTPEGDTTITEKCFLVLAEMGYDFDPNMINGERTAKFRKDMGSIIAGREKYSIEKEIKAQSDDGRSDQGKTRI